MAVRIRPRHRAVRVRRHWGNEMALREIRAREVTRCSQTADNLLLLMHETLVLKMVLMRCILQSKLVQVDNKI